MTTRREFLAAGAAAGLALGGRWSTARAASPAPPPYPGRSLRLLILGGTSFLGPHQIAYAMGRGHTVSTFTRGRTVPTVHGDLFEDVEELIGDREGELAALRGRTWDAVIDNSGRRASWTRASARLLRGNADLYLYTSSTGVYYPYLGRDIGEDTTLVLEVPEGISEEESVEYGYGVMKARSEMEARSAFGDDRTIVVRPTYMMGPADPTDRFTWWPVRLARGGEILVPGHADDPVQYVDVRDVAAWMIRLIEGGVVGTFNAVGPASSTGMHRFVYGAHAAFASKATFVSVDDYGFLLEHGLSTAVPWIMPVGNNAGSARVSNELAMARGLTFTPLADSVRDIYEWWSSGAVPPDRRAAMVSGDRSLMAREAAILAEWKARS